MVSYSVSQRTHELGIRMALGAAGKDVMALVLRQGAQLALADVALGLLGAFWLTGLLKDLLFGVGATDPLTFAAVASLLVAVSLVTCYSPARRAAAERSSAARRR